MKEKFNPDDDLLKTLNQDMMDGKLIGTIKLPRNLKELNSNLPAPNYEDQSNKRIQSAVVPRSTSNNNHLNLQNNVKDDNYGIDMTQQQMLMKKKHNLNTHKMLQEQQLQQQPVQTQNRKSLSNQRNKEQKPEDRESEKKHGRKGSYEENQNHNDNPHNQQ